MLINAGGKCIVLLIVWLVTFSARLVADESATSPLAIADSQTGKIVLSEEEKLWLAANPVVTVCYIDFPPYCSNEERYDGIFGDYIKMLLNDIGLNYRVKSYGSLIQFIELERQGIDLPDISPGPIQMIMPLNNYQYTDGWLLSEVSLFSRTGDFLDINDLDIPARCKIAVVEGGSASLYLRNQKLSDYLVEVQSPLAAFELFQSGDAAAVAMDKLSGLYYAKTLQIKNLAMVDLEDCGPLKLATAVRRDKPELYSIIKKAMANIPSSKILELKRKYCTNIELNKSLQLTDIIKIAFAPLLLCLFLLLVLILVLLRSRSKLEYKVALRTSELNEKNTDLELAMAKVQETQGKLILSEKMGAIGKLLAGIAHEINTPLGVISAASEKLGDNLEKVLDSSEILSGLISADKSGLIMKMLIEARANASAGLMLTTRQRRDQRSGLVSKLERWQVKNAEIIADVLSSMNISDEIDIYRPLLMRDNALEIVSAVASMSMFYKLSDIIENAVDKASRISFALRNYVYADSIDNEVQLSPVDVKISIESITVLYHNDIIASGNLFLEFADNLPPVAGIIDSLNQVWSNLIKNAIQAISQGGEIFIRANSDNGGVRIDFSDNGCGMSQDVVARIFEPLFTTRARGEGTGLGMYIVKQIVEKHGGTISVISEVDKGTTISIWLPTWVPDGNNH